MVYDYIDRLRTNVKQIYNIIGSEEQVKLIEINKCVLFSDDLKVISKGSQMIREYLECFNDKQKFNDWMYSDDNVRYLVDSLVRLLEEKDE